MNPNLASAEWLELEKILAQHSRQVDAELEWPTNALMACGKAGVYRWFAPKAIEGCPKNVSHANLCEFAGMNE